MLALQLINGSLATGTSWLPIPICSSTPPGCTARRSWNGKRVFASQKQLMKHQDVFLQRTWSVSGLGCDNKEDKSEKDVGERHRSSEAPRNRSVPAQVQKRRGDDLVGIRGCRARGLVRRARGRDYHRRGEVRPHLRAATSLQTRLQKQLFIYTRSRCPRLDLVLAANEEGLV